jgi:polar amino acid transport system substrate-binding protein
LTKSIFDVKNQTQFQKKGLKKMSRLTVIIAMTVAIILVTGCIATTSEQKHVAVVSGHTDWKPIMWNEGQKIVGIGPDVTKMVFKDINVDAESQYVGSWDVVQEKAKTGEIDAIVALYKTKQREEYLEYSIPYTTDPIVLSFNPGKGFTYNQKEDLIGKRGIVTIGDSYGQEIDDFIITANLSMVEVKTPQEAFSLLETGKVDYFIYSAYAGRSVINESHLSRFEESRVVSNQLFYIGVSKKSPFAKEMKNINASLERLIKEGKIPQ